jgi:hypothetical protein
MEGSKFTILENGWVTCDIFLDFFKNHFLTNVTERPAILLYDGHATHIIAGIKGKIPVFLNPDIILVTGNELW